MVARKTTTKTETVEKEETIQSIPPTKIVSRSRKKKIDLDREILCKNLTSSKLQYISRRNGMEIVWNKYGDEQWVDAEELVAMKSSQPKFVREPWIYIDDKEMVQHLGLESLYKKLDSTVDIESLFTKKAIEVQHILEGLPKSMQEVVADKAREGIKNETLTNLQVVRTIEKVLNTDLMSLLD
jgi:hypothetical protein